MCLDGLNAYYSMVPTIYAGTVWEDCTNQTLLNARLVERVNGLLPSTEQYVTQIAFDAVKSMVYVCLEDWPAAAGSVFNVVTDLYQLITGSRSTSQREYTVPLETRISAIEEFLRQNYNYIPPN